MAYPSYFYALQYRYRLRIKVMSTVAETQPEPSKSEDLESSTVWWSARRWRYNLGLVGAGIMAFVACLIVLGIFSDTLKDVEVTAFTIAFQAVGYLICMVIANVCYQLGPLTEHWLHPKNTTKYRRITFALGFWFSVALPFSIPMLLAIFALLYPHSSPPR